MLKLIATSKPLAPAPLTDGEAVTIGRHPENTVVIQDELASRRHCSVELARDGSAVVRDLGSRNGTRVNGELIENAVMTPGDVLRVGSHEFQVEPAAPALDEPAAPETPIEVAPAAEPAPKKRRTGKKRMLPQAPPEEWEEKLTAVSDGTEGAPELIDSRGTVSSVLSGDGPGPRAARLLLTAASACRATDIHAEPRTDDAHVRFRVDGQMVSVTAMPKQTLELVLGLIRTACQFRQASADTVQDGRFSVVFPDRRVDYRVSLTPSVHGPKLVLRVLDRRDAPTSLGAMGLPPYVEERVRRVCRQDAGLLLSCGPTGSGKTTTLYNALREIDREVKNVVTIENPVEYELDHVTQIPTDDSKGNTFANLLRAVLRQDPDVILVGEIRDNETAQTAMQAAMTGHLVFSTVHAKDSISAIFRLLDLKVEPYLLANALEVILAQRLVRVLCPHCKSAVPVTSAQASRMGKFLGGAKQLYVPVGCPRCLRTGYLGRHALFEPLDITDAMRDVILSGEPTIAAFRKVASQSHFHTLSEAGWKLVAEGITSLDEVERVATSR